MGTRVQQRQLQKMNLLKFINFRGRRKSCQITKKKKGRRDNNYKITEKTRKIKSLKPIHIRVIALRVIHL